MSDQRHDAIGLRAYELWEQEGGEHGRHEEHWHRAAREVDGEPVNVAAPDGTTMPVPTAIEAAGTEQQAPVEPAAEPADAPTAKPGRRRTASVAKAAGEPADTPADPTPAKTAAKPRKPKAK